MIIIRATLDCNLIAKWSLMDIRAWASCQPDAGRPLTLIHVRRHKEPTLSLVGDKSYFRSL